MEGKKKIIRTATVPLSLDLFCRGLFRSLSQDYEIIVLSSPLKELESIREREGVRTIAVPMKRKIAPLSDLVSLFRLISVFRKEKPDMVHSITPKGGLLSMMAAKAAGVPVRVHTFTGLIFPYVKGWKKALLHTTDRITAACATHIIPEGEGIKNDLVSYGITHKPLKVLGNGNLRGIDLDYYKCDAEDGVALRAELAVSKESFVFLYAGRFDMDKGLRELFNAFGRLTASGADVHLLLAGAEMDGDKPLPPEMSRIMIDNPRIHASRTWLSDVRPWYAAADALVLPSYREGFPNVVLEAGAMGLASIVTDVNGSREIISDGQNGVIIPAHDEEALYRTMYSWYSDPAAVRVMAQNAREMVSDRYEQQYVRQCLEDYYREILS